MTPFKQDSIFYPLIQKKKQSFCSRKKKKKENYTEK